MTKAVAKLAVIVCSIMLCIIWVGLGLIALRQMYKETIKTVEFFTDEVKKAKHYLSKKPGRIILIEGERCSQRDGG